MDTEKDQGPFELERRQFLKSSALFGAGLFLTGPTVGATRAESETAALLYGNGGLTSIAIVDDCARLARHADALNSDVTGVLRRSVNHEHPGNAALIGGMAPMDADEAVTLLGRVREDWAQREEDGTEEKLALILGWMVHQAARRQLKPLHNDGEADQPGLYPSELSLYHDAAVLRHRSRTAPDAGNGQQTQAVARLFREVGPRILVRFHTFIPDYDDGSGWVGRMSSWRHEKESLLHRLAEAYQNPDPEKLRRYVTAPNFYDEDDATIRVARTIQNGEEPPMTVDKAVSTTNGSHYAQALVQGYGHVQAAGEYFAGEMEALALRDRLRS